MDTQEKQQVLTPQYVVESYEAYKKGDRDRKTVAKSNWPTVLAHSCTAYAAYMRMVPPNQRRGINTHLAMIFSEGNDQARMVKRDLIDAGFEVSGAEDEISWPEYQISGRRDLVLWKPGMANRMRTEVKSCSPFTYDAIRSASDLVSSNKDWMRKWARQVALYMILQGVDTYWLLLKNKSTGAIKIVEFKMNDEILECGEAMIKKAETVNKLVQIGQMPSPEMKLNDPDTCSDCEFLNVCLPDLQFGPGIRVLTDEDAAELQLMLDRRSELEPFKKEYETIDEDVKEAIKGAASEGQSKVVVGDWYATIKETQRKAYSVAASVVKSVRFFKTAA